LVRFVRNNPILTDTPVKQQIESERVDRKAKNAGTARQNLLQLPGVRKCKDGTNSGIEKKRPASSDHAKGCKKARKSNDNACKKCGVVYGNIMTRRSTRCGFVARNAATGSMTVVPRAMEYWTMVTCLPVRTVSSTIISS